MAALAGQQIEQYQEEGYLILEALIHGERLARYRAIFDELVERSRALAQSEGGYNLAPDAQGRPAPSDDAPTTTPSRRRSPSR